MEPLSQPDEDLFAHPETVGGEVFARLDHGAPPSVPAPE